MAAVTEAQKDLEKTLKEFCDRYGAFNTTLKKDSNWMLNPFNFMSMLFDL